MPSKRKSAADAIASVPTAAEKRAEQGRIRELEKQVAAQQQTIERLRSPKVRPPRAKRSKARKTFVRVIVPDLHGCFLDEAAVAAFLADYERLQPAEVVILGDLLDCGGFLAQHHTWGYVAEADYTYEDDTAAANQFLDVLQRVPARFHYLQGNHERRVETWCVTQALRGKKDAAFLQKLFGPVSTLNLEQRGIAHYAQGVRYGDCPIPATVKLGKCYFTHGHYAGANAARRHAETFAAPVVFGHVHRRQSYSTATVHEGGIEAWCVGCLCRLQPLWRHEQITGWGHGYGFQLVEEDGSFLHVTVPIIDGHSYLSQLAGRLAE